MMRARAGLRGSGYPSRHCCVRPFARFIVTLIVLGVRSCSPEVFMEYPDYQQHHARLSAALPPLVTLSDDAQLQVLPQAEGVATEFSVDVSRDPRTGLCAGAVIQHTPDGPQLSGRYNIGVMTIGQAEHALLHWLCARRPARRDVIVYADNREAIERERERSGRDFGLQLVWRRRVTTLEMALVDDFARGAMREALTDYMSRLDLGVVRQRAHLMVLPLPGAIRQLMVVGSVQTPRGGFLARSLTCVQAGPFQQFGQLLEELSRELELTDDLVSSSVELRLSDPQGLLGPLLESWSPANEAQAALKVGLVPWSHAKEMSAILLAAAHYYMQSSEQLAEFAPHLSAGRVQDGGTMSLTPHNRTIAARCLLGEYPPHALLRVLSVRRNIRVQVSSLSLRQVYEQFGIKPNRHARALYVKVDEAHPLLSMQRAHSQYLMVPLGVDLELPAPGQELSFEAFRRLVARLCQQPKVRPEQLGAVAAESPERLMATLNMLAASERVAERESSELFERRLRVRVRRDTASLKSKHPKSLLRVRTLNNVR